MIYLFTEYNLINDNNFPALFEKLPEQRQHKALRFRNSGGRISCVVGYLLFLFGFRNIYRQNGSPEFACGKNGKPYLKDYPDIFFNISHCNGAAACVFDDVPVGIDIQDIRSTKPVHIRRVCSENEINLIKAAKSHNSEFCRIWSVKEAVSKLNADGVFRDIRQVSGEGYNLFTTLIGPDKYMSAVSSDNSADFSVHVITLDDLLSL